MTQRDRVAIVTIPAASAHELRRRVLRDGTPSDRVDFDGDDDGFHLAATIDGVIVAVSSWLPTQQPTPAGTPGPGIRLRGMATEPGLQGTGIGGRLLEAGVARSKHQGARFVIAHARLPALGFYLAHGFEVVGDEFVDATTGLPHRVITRTLGIGD